MSLPEMVKIGPIGKDDEGFEWNVKGFDEITRIYISYTPSTIVSLQFKYTNLCARNVLSLQYGKSNGSHFNVVSLDDSEYITGVKGMFDREKGIRSLTFITDKRKFGPFGYIDGDDSAAGGSGKLINWPVCSYTPFDLQFGDSRRLAGFFGRLKDGQLTSIGVYLWTN
ncbi:jacalin-related lectin 2-like [Hibiscus syriacus]|uniref:jacalin-related lectin 2-like n=1 Tax=Hibiscus syriacus TaxID=106335 RepID=UPI0019227D2D|nr:jacalin-related lectin 2-like [Hibiscus syriacus]